ncbi:hypothetical protein APHAL10511_003127, partial [Amanita phalloides]
MYDGPVLKLSEDEESSEHEYKASSTESEDEESELEGTEGDDDGVSEKSGDKSAGLKESISGDHLEKDDNGEEGVIEEELSKIDIAEGVIEGELSAGHLKGKNTTLNVFGENEVVQKDSLPVLQGASWTTGGTSRSIRKRHGAYDWELKVFNSGEDPSARKPQMTLKVKVSGNLAPVLGELAKCYSPVKKKNKRIFVYEEGDWSVKGCFQTALEDNDPIFWEKESGEYSLCVALEDEGQPRTYDFHQGQVSGTPALTQAAQQPVADYKSDLVHIFGIPTHLLRDYGKNEGGLLLYYKKYKACLAALATSGGWLPA